MRARTATLALAGAFIAGEAAALDDSAPVSYSAADARRGAQLRSEASIVIPIIFNLCGTSSAMEPTRERYTAFHDRLSNPRQRLDLAIARADFDYQMSLVDMHCPEPEDPQTLEIERIDISVANAVLDRMDRLVDQPSGQDN